MATSTPVSVSQRPSTEVQPRCGDCADLQNDHVFNELPSVLQTGVAFELTEPLLAQSHIFGPLKPQARRMVTSRLKPVSLPAGHDLCKVGDCADCLWILQDGELACANIFPFCVLNEAFENASCWWRGINLLDISLNLRNASGNFWSGLFPGFSKV